jgi:hypothetical protein
MSGKIRESGRGRGRRADKGNNIGTSYLESGSERAFKGLDLGAIIESPRSFRDLAEYQEIGRKR